MLSALSELKSLSDEIVKKVQLEKSAQCQALLHFFFNNHPLRQIVKIFYSIILGPRREATKHTGASTGNDSPCSLNHEKMGCSTKTLPAQPPTVPREGALCVATGHPGGASDTAWQETVWLAGKDERADRQNLVRIHAFTGGSQEIQVADCLLS